MSPTEWIGLLTLVFGIFQWIVGRQVRANTRSLRALRIQFERCAEQLKDLNVHWMER